MAKTAYDKLNVKQKRFVDHYLVHLVGTEAATAAGYGPKRVDVAAAKLLARPDVQAAIAERMKREREHTELSEFWVLQRLRLVAERCLQAEPVRDAKGNETGEYRFDSSGANRALELIGKHFAMFTDNVNLREFDNLSDDELDRRIAEKQREAGLTPVTH